MYVGFVDSVDSAYSVVMLCRLFHPWPLMILVGWAAVLCELGTVLMRSVAKITALPQTALRRVVSVGTM